jgi:hypothetical protein
MSSPQDMTAGSDEENPETQHLLADSNRPDIHDSKNVRNRGYVNSENFSLDHSMAVDEIAEYASDGGTISKGGTFVEDDNFQLNLMGGLRDSDVEKRRKKYGWNELPDKKKLQVHDLFSA